MKEASIKHPTLGVKHFVVVRIDNGTGVLELMPETAFEFTK
jgi:hypothetical protein